jgi:serine/threonine protein kinase
MMDNADIQTPDPDDVLADFYEAEKHQLTNEERRKLTPILDLLKNFHERYEDLGEIGTGGEKIVSRVYDHRLGRCVAMARPANASTLESQEQFLREARLAASLSQPNILPIHNMGIDQKGIPFFTMELLPGDSLGDILQKIKGGNREYHNKYPLESLLGIFIKVCDAIAYAHSCSVLHLDLKPANIRVGEFGDVIVCDWGLARVLNNDKFQTEIELDDIAVDDLNDATLTGIMKGTPGFMSPEQAEGKTEKTLQTDIYALGAILYMILTLETPVSGKSTHEILENTRKGNIVPPKMAGSRPLPVSLAAVAMKALSLNPEQRYKHVPDLLDDLALYLNGYATEAEHAGAVKRLMLFSKRNSTLTFLLSSFLLILAGLSIGGIMMVDQERKAAVAAKEESDKNLRLYLEEQATSTRLGKANTEIINYLLDVPDLYNATPTLAILEEQMQNGLPEDIRAELLKTKGVLHFVLEEFSSATQTLEQIPESKAASLYLPVCRKYARQKPDDKQMLSERELYALFRDEECSAIDKSILQFCFVNHIRRNPAPPTEEYLPLASQMLEFINGMRRSSVEMLKLTKKHDGYYLDLSESKFSRLRIFHNMKKQSSILYPLELKHLDISFSSITDIQELGAVRTDELNMYGLRLKSEWFVASVLKKMGVQHVILDTKNYSERTLEMLSEFCKISDPSLSKKKLDSLLLELSP